MGCDAHVIAPETGVSCDGERCWCGVYMGCGARSERCWGCVCACVHGIPFQNSATHTLPPPPRFSAPPPPYPLHAPHTNMAAASLMPRLSSHSTVLAATGRCSLAQAALVDLGVLPVPRAVRRCLAVVRRLTRFPSKVPTGASWVPSVAIVVAGGLKGTPTIHDVRACASGARAWAVHDSLDATESPVHLPVRPAAPAAFMDTPSGSAASVARSAAAFAVSVGVHAAMDKCPVFRGTWDACTEIDAADAPRVQAWSATDVTLTVKQLARSATAAARRSSEADFPGASHTLATVVVTVPPTMHKSVCAALKSELCRSTVAHCDTVPQCGGMWGVRCVVQSSADCISPRARIVSVAPRGGTPPSFPVQQHRTA